MKNFFALSLIILWSCGGSLSDEQRKKMREGMEENKIVRVTDSEIVSAAHTQGQVIYHELEKVNFNSSSIDSIGRKYKADIRWLTPRNHNAADIENQLIEAYIMGMASGTHLQDNVQKMWKGTSQKEYDSLIYSRPVVKTHADGVDELEGIWNIYLSRKQIILDLSKKNK